MSAISATVVVSFHIDYIYSYMVGAVIAADVILRNELGYVACIQ